LFVCLLVMRALLDDCMHSEVLFCLFGVWLHEHDSPYCA
jgi:hypothetical protein